MKYAKKLDFSTEANSLKVSYFEISQEMEGKRRKKCEWKPRLANKYRE